MRGRSCLQIVIFSLALLPGLPFPPVQAEEAPDEAQIREFLRTAEVIRAVQSGKGVTRPYRFTLKKGDRVHDASFQPVDEATPMKRFDDGSVEMNFRDSYKYNIAAYELAGLLGLGNMMPVTVERRWKQMVGSLSWWLPAVMDEETRREKGIRPPDRIHWDGQMFKMAVFSELVYDTDRHYGNILISQDWHLWMIDFSRAFRLYSALRTPGNLIRCERKLLERLRNLRQEDVAAAAGAWLTLPEIRGVMARRDNIVTHFEARIARMGAQAVLYDHP